MTRPVGGLLNVRNFEMFESKENLGQSTLLVQVTYVKISCFIAIYMLHIQEIAYKMYAI